MKKKPVIIAIIVVLVIAVAVGVFFAVRSSGGKDEVAPPSEGEQITLDTAVIKNADSIAFIESYEPSEIGLDGTWDDYDWVVHKTEGEYIDNGKYKGYFVRIEVGNKQVNEENGTFTVDVAGVYYISYDGETFLKYDSETGDYTRIKDVHDIPEVTLPGETTAPETTEAAD